MSDPNYDEIRKRITKRYENRAEFFGHLVAFITINALAWFIFPSSGVLVAFTALWFMGVVIHFINFVLTEARERAIEQAIERERRWVNGSLSADEKPKRDRRTRLTDDGELWEVVEEERETRQKHRS
jgi:hypothetical protein